MIKLRKMTKEEYKVFIKKSIKRYAKECVKSGFWTKKEAYKESKAQYKRNLGKGFKKSKFDFYKILNEEHKKIGDLFLVKEHKLLFVGELYIREKYRHQGYGRSTLAKVEKIAKKLKYKKIGLTVAKHNKIAQSLYSQCNIRAISEFRMKRI
jgi:ribosomal protein S18 acetylase RimI-like enzyme